MTFRGQVFLESLHMNIRIFPAGAMLQVGAELSTGRSNMTITHNVIRQAIVVVLIVMVNA